MESGVVGGSGVVKAMTTSSSFRALSLLVLEVVDATLVEELPEGRLTLGRIRVLNYFYIINFKFIIFQRIVLKYFSLDDFRLSDSET